jgi:hypothetical protein
VTFEKSTGLTKTPTYSDKALKNRIRKIPGVPIISCAKGKYVVEKLPDAPI